MASKSAIYAMRWKTSLDADDFPQRDAREPFSPIADSKRAFADSTQTADVAAEQHKLLRADLVIFQFPLWWFSMPAIMKGWFERVYAYGFAYGVGEHSERPEVVIADASRRRHPPQRRQRVAL